MTERGKQIGSILMTFGPALAAKALDETAQEKRKAEAVAEEKHGEMLARLDRIAALLEANPSSIRIDVAPDTIRT
jgi:transcriptional antiterminator Rof (Rho-off)